MGHFATGVGVLTAADARGRPFGTTANAISSLSLDPPLVLACLRRESETLTAVRETGRFAVNLLAAGQRELSERFARRAAAGLWDGVAHRLPDGVPVLDGALAAVECAVHEIADGGDHVIVIGRVLAVEHPVEHVDPLVYYRGAYAELVAPPVVAPEIALPSGLGALRMVPLPQRTAAEVSVAVLVGEPRGSTGALLYVHRGCLLGDALGSTVCGGRRRLHAVVAEMHEARGPGVVVYHREAEAGFGTCCLRGDDDPALSSEPSAAERTAVRDAIALLELRAPVRLGAETRDLRMTGA
jgi:3-hydroxy-9,10-secoandrosta-1,3,5(10)-triene-9,17-dione monooxygenase reductase component